MRNILTTSRSEALQKIAFLLVLAGLVLSCEEDIIEVDEPQAESEPCLLEERGGFGDCDDGPPPPPPPPPPPSGPPCGDLMGLARHYAPYVFFHSEEQYYPSSVDWYLPRTRMWSSRIVGLVSSSVTTQNIDQISGNGETASQIGNHLYLSHINTAARSGHWPSSKVYVHLKPAPYGEVDIQYWFFYPYNGDLDVEIKLPFPIPNAHETGGSHQGDWEHITIRLKTNCRGIRAIYYGAHGSEGRWHNRASLYFGDRPVVYAAKNSHAFYRGEGEHERSLVDVDFGFFNVVSVEAPDYTNKGLGITTSDRLVLAEDETNTYNQAPLAWTNFKGRWGFTFPNEEATHFDNNGPKGPKSKTHWKVDPPLSNQCAQVFCSQGYVCINGDCIRDDSTDCDDCRPGEICDNGWCRPL